MLVNLKECGFFAQDFRVGDLNRPPLFFAKGDEAGVPCNAWNDPPPPAFLRDWFSRGGWACAPGSRLATSARRNARPPARALVAQRSSTTTLANQWRYASGLHDRQPIAGGASISCRREARPHFLTEFRAYSGYAIRAMLCCDRHKRWHARASDRTRVSDSYRKPCLFRLNRCPRQSRSEHRPASASPHASSPPSRYHRFFWCVPNP